VDIIWIFSMVMWSIWLMSHAVYCSISKQLECSHGIHTLSTVLLHLDTWIQPASHYHH